jgi:hypothetical protein
VHWKKDRGIQCGVIEHLNIATVHQKRDIGILFLPLIDHADMIVMGMRCDQLRDRTLLLNGIGAERWIKQHFAVKTRQRVDIATPKSLAIVTEFLRYLV